MFYLEHYTRAKNKAGRRWETGRSIAHNIDRKLSKRETAKTIDLDKEAFKILIAFDSYFGRFQKNKSRSLTCSLKVVIFHSYIMGFPLMYHLKATCII